MATTYNYAILRVVPDVRRGECVNIGAVIFVGGAPDVRIAQALNKVHVLNGLIDLSRLKDLPQTIEKMVNGSKSDEEQHAALRHLGVVTVSGMGAMVVQQNADYERSVAQLMKRLVEPIKGERRPNATRLHTELKQMFRIRKILGADFNDIALHRVVPNYPIAEEEDLYADFVLKNSVYHVTETADFRASSLTTLRRHQVAALAALKLDRAGNVFKKGTKRLAVFAAGSSGEVKHQVKLLEDYADKVYSVDSRRDMAAYFEHIMAAASHTHSITRTKVRAVARA